MHQIGRKLGLNVFAITLAVTLIGTWTIPLSASAYNVTLLTAKRKGRFTHDLISGQGTAFVKTGRDRGLITLNDPTDCSTPTGLEIRFYTTADGLMRGPERQELSCGNWRKSRGGYVYRDRTGIPVGGITKIKYKKAGFMVRANTPGYVPIPGPLGFAQVKFDIGGEYYMVRMHSFRRNGPDEILTRRLTKQADDGEKAFWDTLFGIEDRSVETLDLLRAATKKDPEDGRSYFLEGMMNLTIFGRQTDVYTDATPEQAKYIENAVDAFHQALPLLWDGTAGDTRALGFVGSAEYTLGVLTDDQDLIDAAQATLDFATDVNPLFNTFTPIGPISPIFPGDAPEYQALIELIDEYFPIAFVQCIDQGELCFNAGLAPHNLAGTFLFFGDIYAKGGDVESARALYQAAVDQGILSGWNPVYLATAEERLENVEARVAIFSDGDPSNDPWMLGSGNATCNYCHTQ